MNYYASQMTLPLKTLLCGAIRQPHCCGGLCQSETVAIKNDSAIIAFIIGLILSRRPSHIAGSVMSFVVDAINRVLGRGARPNVCQELVKRCEYHLNAAPPVVTVSGVSGVIAATFNFAKNLIFRAFALPVFSNNRTENLAMNTSAASRGPLSHSLSRHGSYISTVAAALPLRFSVFTNAIALYHIQSPKSPSGHINKRFTHTRSITPYKRSV
jgi:hypothetical protein